jgi:hypothetical protein
VDLEAAQREASAKAKAKRQEEHAALMARKEAKASKGAPATAGSGRPLHAVSRNYEAVAAPSFGKPCSSFRRTAARRTGGVRAKGEAVGPCPSGLRGNLRSSPTGALPRASPLLAGTAASSLSARAGPGRRPSPASRRSLAWPLD